MTQYQFLDLGAVNEPYRREIDEALLRVSHSGRYIGGAEVERFEQMLAAITGTEFAVGVSNGLDALRLILRAYIELGEMHPGDEVIVPANTYIASILAVTDCGLRAVPVEPDPSTLNIDSRRIEEAITGRTRAIMTVHLYGRAAWDDTMRDIALRHKLKIVEDNAQAIGATAAAQPLTGSSQSTGALGHAAAFSFYPTKNIGALGDAGAVTTNDETLARTVRALANYGSDRRYHNLYAGFNCRMDPIQAAVLAVKLPHLDEETALRRANADAYAAAISNPALTLPDSDCGRHVWHQYVVRCPRRDRLKEMLLRNGVMTDIHYATPPHMQPCYSDGRLTSRPLPLTERLASEVLSLPVSRCTSTDDARRIADIINKLNI